MCTNTFLYNKRNLHYLNFSKYHVSTKYPKKQWWNCVNP